MPSVFVHIGMPKCGSTALQRTLAGNRGLLHKHGVSYPGEAQDHVALCARFHRAGTGHFYFRNTGTGAAEAETQADALMAEVADASGDVILSSEYLHNLGRENCERLAETISAMGHEPVFACYVRHPVDAAISGAQQSIKRGERRLHETVAAPGWHSARKTLAPVLKAVGREHMMVRAFHDTKEDGIARHFLGQIGHDAAGEAMPKTRANRSLSMTGALIADRGTARRRANLPSRFNAQLAIRVAGPKFTLPESTKQKVREESAEEIAWVRDTFGVTLQETSRDDTFRETLLPREWALILKSARCS